MALTPNEIRQALFMRINQAQVHYDLLVGMRDATAEDASLTAFNRNLRFFASVESALFNSTVVLLYSLYETRGNTVNFFQLIASLPRVDPTWTWWPGVSVSR